MAYTQTLSAEAAFDRYEQVRHRLPRAAFPAATQECSGLMQIADHFDAFLLDSFGVLNVGETAINGAVDCLSALKASGKRLIVLTNAASYTLETAVQRYHRLGFDFQPEEVISSRDVAARRLQSILPGGRWGAIAAPDDRFQDFNARIEHWHGQEVDGFLFLSSASLNSEKLEALKKALEQKTRPLIVGNPDLVAPRENGLSKEPGLYAHEVADVLGCDTVFFGKPFTDAFTDAMARLDGIEPDRIAMVGDTLHTDILGGKAAGARTVLVRDHGLFAGLDSAGFIARSGIVPDFVCGSI
ncbi:MAG: HAD family hydrolase [Pseudomonadota bacterium]